VLIAHGVRDSPFVQTPYNICGTKKGQLKEPIPGRPSIDHTTLISLLVQVPKDGSKSFAEVHQWLPWVGSGDCGQSEEQFHYQAMSGTSPLKAKSFRFRPEGQLIRVVFFDRYR